MISVGGKVRPAQLADTPKPYKASIERVTLATMTSDLRTDLRSPDNGGDRLNGDAGPVASELTATDERPSDRRRFRPFRLRKRNGGQPATEAVNGAQQRRPATDGGPQAPNGRKPATEDRRKRKGKQTQRTPAPSGRPRTSVPRMHGIMLVVLVATTVITGIASLVFSYGNVRNTLIGLGWESWLASLYTPAVDVTVIGLILVGQYLVTAGIEPHRLARANRLLAGAGLAMLGANVAPSLITGYAHDQPAAYGRALADAVLPAILIAWSHIGPYLIGLFAEIRDKAEAAALDVATQRTIATEADRAAAAAALTDALAEAERIRTEAGEELAAAAAVRQREERAAQDAERERTESSRKLADWIAEQERTTADRVATRERSVGSEAAGKMRQAELLAERAQAELAEARRIAAQAAADRERATSERDAAAADRRAAEELLAGATAPAPRERTPRERTPREPADAGTQADNVTSVAGRMTITDRVAAWQAAHPEWASEPVPGQQEIKDFWPGLSSADTISKVRQKLEEAKREAA